MRSDFSLKARDETGEREGGAKKRKKSLRSYYYRDHAIWNTLGGRGKERTGRQ